MNILYTINQAKPEKIAEHLTFCNAQFVPPLSLKVNIQEYAQKLVSYAERLEAWEQDQLVGLVAVYMNDKGKQRAFVTNVSVLPGYAGMGIATQLIEQSLLGARESGFKQITLEVSVDNSAAIRLYKKMNFVIVNQVKSNTLTMSKYL